MLRSHDAVCQLLVFIYEKTRIHLVLYFFFLTGSFATCLQPDTLIQLKRLSGHTIIQPGEVCVRSIGLSCFPAESLFPRMPRSSFDCRNQCGRTLRTVSPLNGNLASQISLNAACVNLGRSGGSLQTFASSRSCGDHR